jgi:S1-C subfamily serine protease
VLTAAGINANASVPLFILKRTNEGSSLASLLKKIAPAMVSIAIKGGVNSALNSSLSKGQGVQRTSRRIDGPADRQMRATGSRVVIDPGEGIIPGAEHSIDAYG